MAPERRGRELARNQWALVVGSTRGGSDGVRYELINVALGGVQIVAAVAKKKRKLDRCI